MENKYLKKTENLSFLIAKLIHDYIMRQDYRYEKYIAINILKRDIQ